MPILDRCCFCGSLKWGTIITGLLGIILAIATLIFVLVTNVKMQTIVIDTLPPLIVKIILAINLVMTVLISGLLVIGAIRRSKYMMLPFVVLGIMLAIGLFISIIYTSVTNFIKGKELLGSIWLVGGLISVAIYVYLWLVVFSYYQLVQEEGGRGPYTKSTYRR
ncbi:uncharacterized protein LOC124594836 [Schistocerca americana]|uniref:uncharacterized protein LOC124594836 n=1 Tax=Schistocerca americana TaxID=7009 RepID=UPI001F4F252B|nr:uncharacterized protein LOC124594836 [Schistocerca americana]XP_047108563.1 uncharacterized protein LOC124777273 [Schistocerca piceifrons]XP_049776019.1 uncharacterized protein LOC126163136 [Schistocerca cancellata]XP_049800427.1 uncharacterized protein LOC126235709 [Schistocerca nitens]XP_049854832.1 uncharacterized protein LOC126335517 [Schistocerca gregaria]XP_049951664.1 uncharacterized protein LOC126458575 [Schistocerca serialis cubense]